VKILYHHRTLGDGAEGIHVSAMVQAFRDLDHVVRVSALIGGKTNVATPRTRVLTRLRRAIPRTAYETLELGYSLVGRRSLVRAIAEWRPDVIYERYTLFNYAGVSAAARAGLPIVIEINAPLAYERAAYEQLTLKRLAKRAEREICSRADLVVAVSTPLKRYLVDEGVPAARIIVVPNGADPTVFKPDEKARQEIRSRYRIPPEAIVIGFTGILRPWHGVDLLVRAVALLAQRPAGAPCHLLIVGDGPSRPEIERIAMDAGLRDRVVVTGRVPHDQIPAHVAAFDVAVSPRATFYASPMKVPEYMAAGAAVVAPDMPNLADLITDGVTGALFTAESVDALAGALHSLMSDGRRRQNLSCAARASILNGRTWRHNAATVLRSLAEVRACA
jgi:glycosyltransferase involved in cell wall biosynthesis